MSEVISAPGVFPQRLEESLRRGLMKAGIEAAVETEPVKGTLLHRVSVTAPQFEEMGPLERQDLVWRIISQDFSPDEQLRISIIYTVIPDELEGK